MKEENDPGRPGFTEDGSGRGGRFDAGVSALLKALRMAFGGLVLVILGMLVYFVGFDSAFQVLPQESVIAMRFGRIIGVYDSGWQWFLPYPVTSYVRVPAAQKTLEVQFNAAQANPNMPSGDNMLIPGRDRYLITADKNIVHSTWSLTYRISDPRKYYTTLMTPANPMDADELVYDTTGRPNGRRGPETTLVNLVTDAVITVTCQATVDDVLYASSEKYVDRVQARLAESLKMLDAGIEIESLILQQSVVPVAVKPAFDAAQAAGAARATELGQAVSYRENLMTAAEAECSAVISNAENYRLQVVEEIAAETKYFEKILEAFELNREATLIPLYYDAVGAVMRVSREKFVLGSGGAHELRMRLNPEPDAAGENGGNAERTVAE